MLSFNATDKSSLSDKPLLSFNKLSAHGITQQSLAPQLTNRLQASRKNSTHFRSNNNSYKQATDNPVDRPNTSVVNTSKTYNSTSVYQQAQNWLRSCWPKASASQSTLQTLRPLLLDNASGQLLAGQLTVLTGPSGSGKSVLLRLLAGLTTISTGDIHLSGTSIFATAPTHWRARIALLGQHPQLVEGSVLDNLQLPYTLNAHHHSTFDEQWHLRQLSHLQRDEQLLHQSTAYLSGGERQLINVLRLLQLQPQVLLLDEPTAALDPQTAADLIKLLVKWLHDDSNRALLWITHDIDSIMPFADSHWHMQAGQLTKLI